MRRRQVDFRFPIKGGRLYLNGHNPLMRLGYPGAIGLKTGYTDAAGRCFVGVARRGGRRSAVVLLNSRDPSKHAPKLLDAALRPVSLTSMEPAGFEPAASAVQARRSTN